jgi:hypothetical protein
MHIDRVSAEKFIAMAGFTLSFLLLLAIVALAFTDGASRRYAPEEEGKATYAECAALPWRGNCH